MNFVPDYYRAPKPNWRIRLVLIGLVIGYLLGVLFR